MRQQFPERHQLLLQKPLPSSEESERAILGAILIDNSMITQAAETLRPADFYSVTYRRIFSAMLELTDARQSIDPILIGEILRRENELDGIGGVAAITNLSFGLPLGWKDISEYVAVVREKSQLRELVQVCSSIQSSALDADEQTAMILAKAQTIINTVCTRDVRGGFKSIAELGFEHFTKLVALRNREIDVTGLKSGLSHLDYLTDGFQPADFIVIGGRPAMGKSALAAQIAVNTCMVTPAAVVAIFSLEMSKEQYFQRMVSSMSQVSLSRMRRGDISQDELNRVEAATATLQAMNIEIDDASSASATQMHSKLMRLRQEKGRLDLVVVDFLQRMSASKRTDGRQQEVSRIAQDLKSLAKDLNIPVIALSSLSRQCEQRQPPKPRMSDLRESGDIESEADLVAFVYRGHYYNKDEDPGLAEFIIEKHRHGPTDTVRLNFLAEFTRFSDHAEYQ